MLGNTEGSLPALPHPQNLPNYRECKLLSQEERSGVEICTHNYIGHKVRLGYEQRSRELECPENVQKL